MGKPSQAVMDFMSKYKIDSDEIWEVHGSTWVVKHKALERVAAEQGITWERPAMLECNSADGVAAMCVFGKLGERLEWSIGEALVARQDRLGGNYKVTGKQAGYVYAMAEKRAKDRVILKLLNAHGSLYSEEEADDFAQPTKRENPHVNRPADFYDTTHTSDIPVNQVPKMKVKDARPEYGALVKEMQRYQDPAELREWATARADVINSLPGQWPEMFKGEYLKHKQSLTPNTMMAG